MLDQTFATRELAKLLGALAHPERIQIVEQLRNCEMDVNSLQKQLGIAHARVSQNLGVLRSRKIVVERRDGRHVFYRLLQPEIAGWIAEGLGFLEREAQMSHETRSALCRARREWGTDRKAGHK